MVAQPWEQSTDERLRPDASTADGAGASPEPGRVGQTLGGRFELRSVLGRGAMGIVYRAADRAAGDREVALKLVLGGRPDGAREARFLREGELTARLDHPGIVRVHGAGELDGTRYLAYELVPGCRTLGDLLGDPAVPRRRLVEVVRDAARALGHAHARGVLHRDVKPSNILVDAEGRTRVADFGLAAATGLERLTQTGAVVGTPTHMSPEQLDVDERLGPTTDVWALGVVLFQAITGGALPFDGGTLIEVVHLIAEARPTPPVEVDPTAPRALSDLCLALLRPDPADRPPHGEAVAQALDAWLAGRPVGVRPPGPRRRLLAVAAAALLGAAALLLGPCRPRDPAQDVELEVAARRLCDAPTALGSDVHVRAALRAQVRGAPADPARRAAGARLDALDALERAARGDQAGARALAEEAHAAAPDVPGLAALRQALAEDAPGEAAARAWDMVYAEGWRRPEVRAQRAAARIAGAGRGPPRGELERQALIEALGELDLAHRARGGGAPPPREREARAAALLLLGRPGDALAALDAAAGETPGELELRWRILAVAALPSLRRGEPAAPWLERLPSRPPPPGAAAEASAAAEVARAHVAAALRRDPTGDAALQPLVDRLWLARRLEPARPLDPDLASRLATAATAIMGDVASAALLGRVAALLEDDVHGLGQLVRFVRGMGAPYKRAVSAHTARLWSRRDQLEPSKQVLLGDSLGVLLREVGREREGERVLSDALELCDDPGLEAGLLLERGLARLDLREDALALADAEAGLAIEPALVALVSLRLLALRKLGRTGESLELACQLLLRPDLAQLGRADVDEAARHAWELGRELERTAELVAPLEHYLIVRRDLAVWSVRLAWLHARAGGVERARGFLADAADLLGADPKGVEYAEAARRAAAALGGEGRVPERLTALVGALERPWQVLRRGD